MRNISGHVVLARPKAWKSTRSKSTGDAVLFRVEDPGGLLSFRVVDSFGQGAYDLVTLDDNPHLF